MARKSASTAVAGKTREEFLSLEQSQPADARAHPRAVRRISRRTASRGRERLANESRGAKRVRETVAEALRAPESVCWTCARPRVRGLRIAGAVNVPLDTLEPAALLASMARTIRCMSCARPARAASCRGGAARGGFPPRVHVDGHQPWASQPARRAGGPAAPETVISRTTTCGFRR